MSPNKFQDFQSCPDFSQLFIDAWKVVDKSGIDRFELSPEQYEYRGRMSGLEIMTKIPNSNRDISVALLYKGETKRPFWVFTPEPTHEQKLRLSSNMKLCEVAFERYAIEVDGSVKTEHELLTHYDPLESEFDRAPLSELTMDENFVLASLLLAISSGDFTYDNNISYLQTTLWVVGSESDEWV